MSKERKLKHLNEGTGGRVLLTVSMDSGSVQTVDDAIEYLVIGLKMSRSGVVRRAIIEFAKMMGQGYDAEEMHKVQESQTA